MISRRRRGRETMTSNWPNQSRQIERKGRRRCRRREGLNCLVVKWVSSTLLSASFHSVFLCFVFFLWMIIVQWPPLPPLATTTTIIHNWPISRHFELVAVSYRIVGRYRLTWSGAQRYPSSSIIGAVSLPLLMLFPFLFLYLLFCFVFQLPGLTNWPAITVCSFQSLALW